MDSVTLRKATQLRLPSELVGVLRTWTSIEEAWLACERPDWVLSLARLDGISVARIVGVVARSLPEWQLPDSQSEEVRLADKIMHDLAASLRAETAPAHSEEIRIFVKGQLSTWNMSRQDGILPKEMRSVLNSYNSLVRSYQQLDDYAKWPWPGRLELVVQHCVAGLVAQQMSPANASRTLASQWKMEMK